MKLKAVISEAAGSCQSVERCQRLAVMEQTFARQESLLCTFRVLKHDRQAVVAIKRQLYVHGVFEKG